MDTDRNSLADTVVERSRAEEGKPPAVHGRAAARSGSPGIGPPTGGALLDDMARELLLPRPTRPRHRLTLLGGFRLTLEEQLVSVPASTQRILSLLALRGRSGRSRLAGSLWPDTTEDRALASLRTAIWRANQVSPGLVEAGHDTVDLADGVEVDVAVLIATAHEVLDGSRRASVDIPGLTRVEGDLLPDWDDEWLLADRERLRQLRLHVLESLAVQLAREGMFGMALDAALAALCADAMRESAHRTLIQIHLAEGNLAEAVRAYQQCCAMLAREFGTAPSAETSRLVGTGTQAMAGRAAPADLPAVAPDPPARRRGP